MTEFRKEFAWMQSIAGGLIPHAAPHVKDERWLDLVHDTVWAKFFSDTPRVNNVRVSYGSAWKSRLGLITLSVDQATTYIQINSLLRLGEVPDCVTRVTIAHEMVHYAHGFGSPLPQRYKHPHRGGVVRRELFARGMAAEYAEYDNWVHNCWYDFHASHVAANQGVVEIFGTSLVASSLPPD